MRTPLPRLSSPLETSHSRCPSLTGKFFARLKRRDASKMNVEVDLQVA